MSEKKNKREDGRNTKETSEINPAKCAFQIKNYTFISRNIDVKVGKKLLTGYV